MRKTILARLLGATMPRTHAAVVSIINLDTGVRVYSGARGGGRRATNYQAFTEAAHTWARNKRASLDSIWYEEAASIDPKAWGRLTDGRCWSRVGNEISVGFIKADDTGRTDIKKLFEELKKAEGRQ